MLRSRSFESTLQQAKRIKIQSTNLTVNYSCHCYYVNVIPLLIHPLSTFSLLGYPSLRFNDPPSRMVIENQRSLAATRQGFKTRLERLQSQSSHQWMSKTRFFTDQNSNMLTSVCSCTKIGSTLIGYTQSVVVLGLRCRQNFSISATLCRGPIIRDCLLRRLATRRQSCCCCLSLGLCIRCCAKR